MKYNPDKGFEKYVSFVLAWLKDRIGLSQYTTKIEFVKYIKEDNYPKLEGGYLADVEIDEMYLDMKVRISKTLQDLFLAGEERSIVMTLIHELSHWFTQPFDNLFDEMLVKVPPRNRAAFEKRMTELNERQTEFIATAIRKSLGEISSF